MHFIREACHRRPVEPLGLVYSRGGTAITMGCLFIAFCGYLISKISNTQPLLQISSETINGDFASPDIGLCASNTSISMVKCSAMFVNWTTVDIPDCWNRFFRPGANTDTIKCYVFETNGTYRMGTSIGIDAVNTTSLIRLDFYWNIGSIKNMSYSTNSIPAISVQLYDPSFSTWKAATVGDSPMEKKIATNIELGRTRATTYFGYSSSIFYRPQKYRAIRPGDAASLFGLMYQGLFSVQLSQSTIDVKTEIIQHTFLSSIALAGGCYGVLTTIYMLLFGMTRLTPWGMVHHVPVFIKKYAHNTKIDKQPNKEDGATLNKEDGFDAKSSKSTDTTRESAGYLDTESVPWFFRNKTLQTAEDDVGLEVITKKPQDKSNHDDRLHLLDNKTDRHSQNNVPQSPDCLPAYPLGKDTGFDGEHYLARINEALCREQQRADELQKITTLLSDRVVELEFILTEYFIDTKYMDKLRFKKIKAKELEEDDA